jgi:hypothetical protein
MSTPALSGTDTVNLKFGEIFYCTEATKNNQHGTDRDNRITIQGYGNDSLAIPSVRCMDLLVNASWATNAGISGGGNTVYDYSLTGNATTDDGLLWIDDAVQTWLAWDTDAATTFDDVANQGGLFAIDPTADILYFCSDQSPVTDGRTYEAVVNDGRLDYALRFFNADFWRLYGIDFHGGYNQNVWCSGNSDVLNDGIFVDSCVFQKTLGDMLKVNTAAGFTFDLTVQNSLFTNQGTAGQFPGHGISLTGGLGHTVLIENNRFEKVDHGMRIGDGTSYTTGVVKRNLFLSNTDDDIWDGGGCPCVGADLEIVYNVCLGSGDAGLQFFGNATDKNKRIKLWHNTVAGAAQDGLILAGADSTCEAHNNAIINCNRQDGQAGTDRDYHIEEAGAAGPDVDDNLVYSNGDTTFTPTSSNDARSATEHASWSAYVTASSQDGSSVNADPRCVMDVPNQVGGAVPTPTSPLLSAGADNSGLSDASTDFLGDPVVTGSPTIGAIEIPTRLRIDKLSSRHRLPQGRLGLTRLNL